VCVRVCAYVCVVCVCVCVCVKKWERFILPLLKNLGDIHISD